MTDQRLRQLERDLKPNPLPENLSRVRQARARAGLCWQCGEGEPRSVILLHGGGTCRPCSIGLLRGVRLLPGDVVTSNGTLDDEAIDPTKSVVYRIMRNARICRRCAHPLPRGVLASLCRPCAAEDHPAAVFGGTVVRPVLDD